MSNDHKDVVFGFKTVICGPSSVGKTCLLNRYCFNSFNFDTSSTIGMNFHSIHLKINMPEEPEEKYIVNSIFDFGAQERFKPLIPKFIDGANGALLVFDLININTFNQLDYWHEQVTSNAVNSKIPIILVGSKSDLLDKTPKTEIISEELIFKYIEERQLDGFFRTSALDNYNFLEVFKELNNLILRKNKFPYALV